MEHYIRDSLKTVFKKRWLVTICIIGVLTPIIIYNYMTAPEYEAVTMIIYEDHNQSPIAPAFQISFGKSIINDQVKEIKSHSLSSDVYRSLPDSIINTFPLPGMQDADFDKDEYIIEKIQKSISTNSTLNSNVIQIKTRAYTEHAAMTIANTIADVLIQRNISVRKEATSSVRQMIEDQLKIFEEQLRESEMILKEFKESGKVTYIEKESEEIFRRITEAEVIYNRIKSLYDATKQRHAFIQKKLAKERKDLVPTITQTTSPWAQKLKETLIDLEVQITTLKVQNYGDDHPKVKSLQNQIEQTKKSLEEETLKITQGENIIDPLSQIQDYLQELISLDIELETYKAQKNALEKIIANYNRHLVAVPEKEMQLAQLIREREVNNQIYTTLLQKREEARIADAQRIGNIRTIDPATMPRKPVKPRKVLNTVLGLFIGLILGAGIVLLIDRMDDSLKTMEDIEKNIDFPVLGSIPLTKFKNNSFDGKHEKGKEKKAGKKGSINAQLLTMHGEKSLFSESFRSLRTYIQFLRRDTQFSSILVTSPTPQDGKSVVAANLALAFSQAGLKTILIDTDLRKPIQHTLFNQPRTLGLTDYLLSDNGQFIDTRDQKEISLGSERARIRKTSSIKTSDDLAIYNLQNNIIRETSEKKLSLITSGTRPLDPSSILSARRLQEVLIFLKTEYDLLIFDTPPILSVSDAVVLSPIVDCVLMVIKAGKSSKDEITRASKIITNKGELIGIVLNQIVLNPKLYYYNESEKS